ncbi:CU044_5270 family protein [Actinomadura kijaniata]|uniref:CU044_5270 family protein n=1 Tax=Actinomadura kijaniata TaxID=46161 RepID=UPI003F1ACF7F
MNDLDLLTEAWDAPEPSPAARAAARAALMERAAAPAPAAPAPVAAPARRRLRMPRWGLRLAAAGVGAAVIATGVTVAQLAGGTDERGRPRAVLPGLPAAPAANAAEALDRAAAATRGEFGNLRPNQWIYTEITERYPEGAHRDRVLKPGGPMRTAVKRYWKRADDKQVAVVEDGPGNGRPKAGPLPNPVPAGATTPEAVLRWAYSRPGMPAEPTRRDHEGTFGYLTMLIREQRLPAATQAVVFRAVARIPGVRLVSGKVDAMGRPAVAVGIVAEKWLRQEILLDARTYAYVGERSVNVRDQRSAAGDGVWESRKGVVHLIAVRTVHRVVNRLGDRT